MSDSRFWYITIAYRGNFSTTSFAVDDHPPIWINDAFKHLKPGERPTLIFAMPITDAQYDALPQGLSLREKPRT
jgi:hypothetical protein